MTKLYETKKVNGRKYYMFKCGVCGNNIEKRSDTTAKSCGCVKEKLLLKNRKLPKDSPFTLLEEVKDQKTKVLVKCKCGNIYKAQPEVIFRPTTKSCLKCQNITNGFENIGGIRKHPLYSILDNMKQRCYNPKAPNYNAYGEIGITICEEWRNSYISFCNWGEANGYSEGMTIDRIDVDKGYTPENCRFIPAIEQRENKHTISTNTSGYTGVSFCKIMKKYVSYYDYNNKRYRCGYYDTPKKAYEARILELKKNNIQYTRKGKLNANTAKTMEKQ